MTSVRRRQRPDWDDSLSTHATPQKQARAFDAMTFSPRPTARELLQEALARIQTAPSPRPQRAKRQRQTAASRPAHPAVQTQPATAVEAPPQLQQAAVQGPSLSSGPLPFQQPTAGSHPSNARHQQRQAMQAAVRNGLVKQHAFGGKPRWVPKAAQMQSGGNEQPSWQPSKSHGAICPLSDEQRQLSRCHAYHE